MSNAAKYMTLGYINERLDAFTSPDIADLLYGDSDPIKNSFGGGMLSGVGWRSIASIRLDERLDDASILKMRNLTKDLYSLGLEVGNDLERGMDEGTDSMDDARSAVIAVWGDVMDYFGLEDTMNVAAEDEFILSPVIGPTDLVWERTK